MKSCFPARDKSRNCSFLRQSSVFTFRAMFYLFHAQFGDLFLNVTNVFRSWKTIWRSAEIAAKFHIKNMIFPKPNKSFIIQPIDSITSNSFTMSTTPASRTKTETLIHLVRPPSPCLRPTASRGTSILSQICNHGEKTNAELWKQKCKSCERTWENKKSEMVQR